MTRYEIEKIIEAVIQLEKCDGKIVEYDADNIDDIRFDVSEAREILLRLIEEYTNIDDDDFHDEDYVTFIEEIYSGKYSASEVLDKLAMMNDKKMSKIMGINRDNVIYLR